MCRKTANRPGSLDYETTHGVYRIGPGEACQAKPARGAASAACPSQQRAVGARHQSSPWPGDRGFEPISLQQGGLCDPDFPGRIPSMAVGDFANANLAPL